MLKIFHFILNIIEYQYKKNLIHTLKNNLPNRIHTVFDIGAHHGETTIELLKNFKIDKIYLFEPNLNNFSILQKTLLKKQDSQNMYLNNFALGSENKKTTIKQVFESSSSTINEIDTSTKYFKRKKRILNLFSKKAKIIEMKIEIKSSSDFIEINGIKKIDLIKIDTEGYEYKILKNIENYLKNVGVILFEHHYDLMIIKNYKFKEINDLLIKNNFKKIFKSKMKFRKSFEYIYINKQFNFG